MNNYEKRTNKKKDAIIHSSLTLFGKHGFSDVSIKDIASLAHVSQVSIYNYFGNKEALVAECAKFIIGDTIKRAEEILVSDDPFAHKLEHALLLCNKEINVSLSKFLSDKASNDQQFLTFIAKHINNLKKEIYMKYIIYGKKEGIINNTLSDTTLRLFIDALNTVGMDIPEAELQAKQAEIQHLFLYGLIGTTTK